MGEINNMKRIKKIFILISVILITIALPFQSFALNNDTNEKRQNTRDVCSYC